MKLRSGLIFLMILALAAAWLPASADTTDFPFLPGMSWNSTVSDVEQAVGTTPDSDSRDVGGSGKETFFKVNNPGLAPAPYELYILLTADGAVSMAVFLYDISSASDKDAVRGRIADEAEKLYGDRGDVLFDSPESMKEAFAGAETNDDPLRAGALGGLEDALREMYESNDEIVRTKGWLVNREYSAMVAWSTEGSWQNTVAVVVANLSRALSMMTDASLPADRTGCFDLPAGLSWACSRDTLTSVLTGAGLSCEFNDNLCRVTGLKGPAGEEMAVMYMFQGDELMSAVYIPDMTYDNLEQLMLREYGSKVTIDTESIRQQARSFLGTPATRADVWFVSDAAYYLLEGSGLSMVVQIGTEAMMAQQ